MSYSLIRRVTVSGFASATGSSTATNAGSEGANPTVLAAQTATLTTRTDNNTGTLTMASGSHGIITGQRLDLYWDGGKQYAVTAGTVSGTSVPIDLGAGDNLPIATTSIKVGIPAETAFSVDGDSITGLACGGQGTAEAQVCFLDAEDALIHRVVLTASGEPFTWFEGDSASNPLAESTPAKVWISHNGASQKTDLVAACVRD